MTSEKIVTFNNIVISFINQLSDYIGITYIKQFNKIIEYNALLPIEQFLVYALPLREKIINRDETYFTNEEDYYIDSTNDTYTLNEILRLKDIYTKLDNKSKDNIWDYFQAMLILSEEYLQIKLKKN